MAMSTVTPKQVRASTEALTRSLDRMTIEEIADVALRKLHDMTELAANLALENAQLQQKAA